MASNRKNFFGLGIVPNTGATSNTSSGDIEYLTSDGKVHVFGSTSNDSIVMEALAATLTNKSISGSTNTLTNIGNASLTNSSITINGTPVSLGGSITVTSPNALTLGTGLLGGTYDGSAPITASIDTSVVVTLTGVQTLTNKTLTAPVLNSPLADTITGLSTTDLILGSQNTHNVIIKNNSITIASTSTTAFVIGTGKLLTLTNNSQTVSLSASATASATYTITYPDAAPAASTALVYDGSKYVWGAAGGWATASATTLTAGATLTLGTQGQQFIIVAGSSTPVTLSTTPFGTSPPTDGTVIRLVGNSSTNTVTISNNDATNGALVNGTVTLYKYYMIEFQYSSTLARYLEVSRNF